jgi:IS5 family transposase
MKMMFLLFFDDVASERELMKIIAERLDYLWFLGYGLEDEIPDHSVLSKPRARWGKEVFEGLFVRTIEQCVKAGLVEGRKLHVDSSLIEADASRESVIKGPPELIAALKRAYRATESKLGEGVTTPESYEAVNDRMMSQSDPDAAMVSRGQKDSRPPYHHHRAIDDQKGVITAVETTPGSVTENRKLLVLLEQHESHAGSAAEIVVGDHKYGTQDNFVACQQRGLITHLGDASKGQDHHKAQGIFPESAFVYDAPSDTYRCPAGEVLRPRRVHPVRHTMEYKAPARACASCLLRAQCTRAKLGRTLPPAQKTRATGSRTCPSSQPPGSTRSPTPPATHGTKLCRCDQQSSFQTAALATALAPADPGLSHRRHPEPAHPPGPPQAEEKRRRGGPAHTGFTN